MERERQSVGEAEKGGGTNVLFTATLALEKGNKWLRGVVHSFNPSILGAVRLISMNSRV